MRLRILTFNAAIQDLRLFGRSLYCPLPWTGHRLRQLVPELAHCAADVVCLQELFHHRFQRQLCADLRQVYPHAAGRIRRGPGLRLGNELLVLSRYPLSNLRLERFRAASPEELRFTSRGFISLDVDLPVLGRVRVFNLHASAGGRNDHPESPVMERLRARQVAQLLAAAEQHPAAIIAGDLNAGPHSSAANYEQLLAAGFADAWVGDGDAVSWDPGNPLVAAGKEAHLPRQRIDHVFLSPWLARRLRPATAAIVLHTHCTDTGRGRVPLSDHYGVEVTLES